MWHQLLVLPLGIMRQSPRNRPSHEGLVVLKRDPTAVSRFEQLLQLGQFLQRVLNVLVLQCGP
jgi:hypothetical protein